MNDCPFCEAKTPTRTVTYVNAVEFKFKPSRNRSARQLKKLMKKRAFHEVKPMVMVLPESLMGKLTKAIQISLPEDCNTPLTSVRAKL